MATKQVVKATDSNIISLEKLDWCYTVGYYFDPLTDQVYSSNAPKHSVDKLFPLTAEISKSGSKSFKLRGIRFSVEQIHDDLSNNADPKLRAAYKKIMASKGKSTEPVTNSSEKWVKVTDWRTLKVGDIIKTDDPYFTKSTSFVVVELEQPSYEGFHCVRAGMSAESTIGCWVNDRFPLYKLETSHPPLPKPQHSKGWIIMHQNQYGLTPIDWEEQASFAKIYHSESEADATLKDLCNADMGSTFVKLEIKNFAITKTNPEFQLT